jgi:hypothetical protein
MRNTSCTSASVEPTQGKSPGLAQHHVETQANRQCQRRRERRQHQAEHGRRHVAGGQQLRAVAEIQRRTRLDAVENRRGDRPELRDHREQRTSPGDANDEQVTHQALP